MPQQKTVPHPQNEETGESKLLHEVVVVRQWVSDLMARLEWKEREPSYRALLAGLHAVRDCLSKDDAIHLGLALPLLLRGLYFDGWRGSRGPAPSRTRKGFIERIHEAVSRDPGIDPDLLAHALFALLADRLPALEIENMRAATPAALHVYWPD